jgi:hypothetical protein
MLNCPGQDSRHDEPLFVDFFSFPLSMKTLPLNVIEIFFLSRRRAKLLYRSNNLLILMDLTDMLIKAFYHFNVYPYS